MTDVIEELKRYAEHRASAIDDRRARSIARHAAQARGMNAGWLRPAPILAVAIPVVAAVALLIAIFGTRTIQFKAPEPAQHGTGAAVQLYAVRMLTSETGWSFGRIEGGGEAVMRTTDGGHTWLNVTPPGPGYVLANYFFDKNRAWSVTFQQGSPSTFWVNRTFDGGLSWTAGKPITPALQIGNHAAPQLEFADATHGWLLVTAGNAGVFLNPELYRTSDGGATWAKVTSALVPQSLRPQCSSSEIHFADTNTGFATGSCTDKRPLLLVTHDGGTHWRTQAFTSDKPLDTFGPIFATSRDGILTEELPGPKYQVLFATHDSGATWSPVGLPGRLYLPLSMSTSKVWWALALETLNANGPALARSNNSGTTWAFNLVDPFTLLNLTPPDTLVGVPPMDFDGNLEGWAVFPSSPLLLHTRDAGTSWEKINPHLLR